MSGDWLTHKPVDGARLSSLFHERKGGANPIDDSTWTIDDELAYVENLQAFVTSAAGSLLRECAVQGVDASGYALVVASTEHREGLRWLCSADGARHHLDDQTQAVVLPADDVAEYATKHGWTDCAAVFDREPQPYQMRVLVMVPGVFAWDSIDMPMSPGGVC